MHWSDLTLNLLYSAIGILLICTAGFLIAWLLWRLLRVKADQRHAVALENKGNCRNIYYLEVKSPEHALQFSFLHNGLPLAEVYLPAEPESMTQPASGSQGTDEPQASKASSVPAASGAETATKTSQSASAAAGKFASLLEQIGELLPGSLGSKLKQRSSTVRTVQRKANRAARAPQRVQRRVTGFRQLGIGKKESASRSSGSAAPQPAVSSGPAIETACFVQTPILEPGQSLDLQLRIHSRRRHSRQGSYPYSIEALPMPVDFPNLAAQPSLQGGTVHFKPVEWWRQALPVLTILVLAFMAVVALIFLYRFIWL